MRPSVILVLFITLSGVALAAPVEVESKLTLYLQFLSTAYALLLSEHHGSGIHGFGWPWRRAVLTGDAQAVDGPNVRIHIQPPGWHGTGRG
jgi:hypothetical protein